MPAPPLPLDNVPAFALRRFPNCSKTASRLRHVWLLPLQAVLFVDQFERGKPIIQLNGDYD
jgi:hypothetical protein